MSFSSQEQKEDYTKEAENWINNLCPRDYKDNKKGLDCCVKFWKMVLKKHKEEDVENDIIK